MMAALDHFNKAKNERYLTYLNLERNSFSTLDEVAEVIQNSINGKKKNGLERLHYAQEYLNSAKWVCEGNRWFHTNNMVCNPLLIYINLMLERYMDYM